MAARITHEKIALNVLVAAESLHAFSAFNPSIFTIRRFKDQWTKEDIQRGCIYATGFALIIGGAVSALTDDITSLVLAGLAAIGMSAVYLREVK